MGNDMTTDLLKWGGLVCITLSLMLMDLDHFKRINDTFGHIAGDHALREVASCIKARVRKEECFARYGGEEFALVLPDAERANVLSFAEKIRRIIEAREVLFEKQQIPITLSIGVAQLSSEHSDLQAFIAAADDRLFRAKEAGRNRVEV